MTFWTAVAILAVSVVGPLLLLLARRLVKETPPGEIGARRSVIAIAGSVYALIVGFVLVLILQNYQAARQTADTEAGAAVALSRTSTLFTGEVRDSITHQLVCYARAVAVYDWPEMRHGRGSADAAQAGDRLFQTIAREAREDGAPSSVLSTALTDVRALGDARTQRLAYSRRELPTLFWQFIVVGGVILLVTLAIVVSGIESPLRYMVFMVPITLLMVFAIYILSAFNAPFSGSASSISPDAMRAAERSVIAFAPDPSVARPCP